MVAISAAEAENPRKSVPKAIKRVFYRCRLLSQSVFSLQTKPNQKRENDASKLILTSIPQSLSDSPFGLFSRILLFYLGGVLVIGLLVPSDEPRLFSGKGKGTGAASPFVIAISRAGISVLPDIVNAVILTSAYSAGNASLCSPFLSPGP